MTRSLRARVVRAWWRALRTVCRRRVPRFAATHLDYGALDDPSRPSDHPETLGILDRTTGERATYAHAYSPTDRAALYVCRDDLSLLPPGMWRLRGGVLRPVVREEDMAEALEAMR